MGLFLIGVALGALMGGAGCCFLHAQAEEDQMEEIPDWSEMTYRPLPPHLQQPRLADAPRAVTKLVQKDRITTL